MLLLNRFRFYRRLRGGVWFYYSYRGEWLRRSEPILVRRNVFMQNYVHEVRAKGGQPTGFLPVNFISEVEVWSGSRAALYPYETYCTLWQELL